MLFPHHAPSSALPVGTSSATPFWALSPDIVCVPSSATPRPSPALPEVPPLWCRLGQLREQEPEEDLHLVSLFYPSRCIQVLPGLRESQYVVPSRAGTWQSKVIWNLPPKGDRIGMRGPPPSLCGGANPSEDPGLFSAR